MHSTPRSLAIAAILPTLLAGCSSTSSHSAPSPSPTASRTADPMFLVATSYLVTAHGEDQRKALSSSLSSLAAMTGVRAASLSSRTTLRVDLSYTITQPQRDAVLTRLRALGTVDVATGP
jgi:hypothetical protein